MSRTKKIILFLALVCVAGVFAVRQFSPAAEIEKRLRTLLEQAGLTQTEVQVETFDTSHVAFSRIGFSKDKTSISAEGAVVRATSLPYTELLRGNVENVAGEWSVASLVLSGIATPLPALSGAGTMARKEGKWAVDGTLGSADKRYNAAFTYDGADMVTITHAAMPWNGGEVSARNARYELSGKLKATVSLKNVSLDALMQVLTGGKASATGAVSGALPVEMDETGRFSIGKGSLVAGGKGIIKMQPGAIPGDNPQLALLSEVLSNFHYHTLEMVSEPGEKNALSLTLRVEGKNPDAYEGKPVKLNVHLTGDVLSFLQQGIVPYTDPKTFLKQDGHDKK